MKWGILVTIILIAIAAGALIYMMGKAKTNTAMQGNTAVTEQMTPVVTPTGIVSGDASDAGLANDSAAVDAKLKTAAEDDTNVDAGLNDVQGNLSEQ